jgi:LysR family glycine cleavage system transcriptional activator
MSQAHRRRKPRISLDLLRSFEAAARHMNFTRAASELFLTQSAVSRGIKTLEQQLDRTLFIRADRGLALTDAGRALQQAVGEALRGIDRATGSLGEPGMGLTVTMNVATAALWLAPRLGRFVREHPGIDLRVFASDGIVNLERAQVDVALRHFPPEARPANVPALMQERVFPVCAPALARGKSLARPEQLARHVLLQFETYTALGPWLDWTRWLEAHGLEALLPAGVVRFSHYDQAVQAAVAGNGVALGRHPLVADHLRDGRLVAPLGTTGVPAGSLHVFLSKHTNGAAAKSFAAWLDAEVARDAAAEGAPRQKRK